MKDSDFAELSAKLHAWRVSPKLSASFQRGVWTRIAARQSERERAPLTVMAAWFASPDDQTGPDDESVILQPER